MMKKKLLLLLMLAMVVSPAVFGRQPDEKDRCSKWFGPYGNGVYYQYAQSYLGMDVWSKDYDCFQFSNENSYQVEITYCTEKNNKSYGPYLRQVNGNTDDDLIAITEGERVSSIGVKRL